MGWVLLLLAVIVVVTLYVGDPLDVFEDDDWFGNDFFDF